MKFFAAFMAGIACLNGISTAFAQTQTIPYRTSFEEPTYTVGNLNGQGGWVGVSDPQNAALVQSDSPEAVFRGSQSVIIQPASIIKRDLSTAPGQTLVYVDGYYRGPTVDTAPDPIQISEPGSSLILFHATLGILALDGDGLGDGDWVPTGVAVSNGPLQRITIRQNYTTQSWDLFLDGEIVLENLGFKNTSVASLSGVTIETSTEGQGVLDDFSVTTVPPDFIGGPALFTLQQEWTRSGGWLNWDVTPLEQDGSVDSNDVLEVLRRLKP